MHIVKPWGGVAAALAAVWLAACGGGSGDGYSAGPAADDPNAPMTATFTSIQSHVFTPICTKCHAGSTAPAGLQLDAANSYGMLVGVDSGEVSSLKRVEAGNADNSYLIHKLEGHQSVGQRMPLGGPYLDQATINLIRQWINNGAAK